MRKIILAITLGVAISPTTIRADFETGLTALLSGDHLKASTEFLSSANEGDPRSQAVIGFMYQGWEGLVVDEEKAVQWLTKAAEQGESEAQFQIGQMYDEGKWVGRKNHTLSLEWYEKAAQQGHAEAQNNLGSQYFNGKGVKRDYVLAHEWYRKSAMQGWNTGQLNLTALLYWGQGTPKNLTESYAWADLCVKSGHSVKVTIRNVEKTVSEFCEDNRISAMRSLLYNQVKKAEELSNKLADKISRNVASRQKSDVKIIRDIIFPGKGEEDPCVSLAESTGVLVFNGFSISRASFNPQCYTNFFDKFEEKKLDQLTSVYFPVAGKGIELGVGESGEHGAMAFVRLVKFEQETSLSNDKQLFSFAKKTKLARKATLPVPGKIKYSHDDTRNDICVVYKRSYRGGRVTGKGFMCVHPNAPSVLVSAEFMEGNENKPRRDEKKKILAQAQEFLESITLTDLKL